MINIQAFGGLNVADEAGQPVDALLAQPKRAVLLLYLTVAGGGGYVRRESMLGLFWPE